MRSTFGKCWIAAVASLALIASLTACGAESVTATSVQMSGAVGGVLAQAANCTKQRDQNTVMITDTINGKLYMFQIVFQIVATHYHGAGTYNTGATEGEPVVTVVDESSGDNWVSQYSDNPGTIIINAGETSGYINATLVSNSDHSHMMVTGQWVCG